MKSFLVVENFSSAHAVSLEGVGRLNLEMAVFKCGFLLAAFMLFAAFMKGGV